MFRCHHVFVSLSVALVTATFMSGCKDDVQATPRVTFDSSIQHGTHSVMDCPQTGPWFAIGSFGNPALGHMDMADPNSPLVDPVMPVDDGGQFGQGTASISCSVTANGANFDVAVHAELSGATGGAMTVSGSFTASGDQMNISVALSKMGETFSQRDCIATMDPALGEGIAAGRVWASIDCANASYATAQQTCETMAEFRFENCTQ